MTEKFKNYFYVAAIIALLASSGSIVSYVKAYSRSTQPSSFRSFTVSGEGKVVAVPDVAQFSFSVTTEDGKDIGKLQKQNTDKVNKIMDYLKDNKIEEKDITTASYNIEPRYQYVNCLGNRLCPPPQIDGYTVRQSVSVKVRDFSKTGAILSGVVSNGANSVSDLQFIIDDPTELANQAREKAIDKAKDKARAIAKAGDFGIGRLLSIDESGSNPNPPMPMYGIGGDEIMKSSVASAPAIAPGSREVTINVNLTYEIK